jgi:hypothetical protein
MNNEICGPNRRGFLKGLAIAGGGYALGSILMHPTEAIGQSTQDYLGKIPMEARWSITAGGVVSLSVDIYKSLLDKEGRDKFREYMMKTAPATAVRHKDLADRFGLTGNDAKSAAAIIPAMVTIVYGPTQKFEIEAATSEKARVKCVDCALWANVQSKKITDDLCSSLSKYYWEGFAKAMNPKLTSTLVKARPLGDPVCEWMIELKA